MAFKNPWGKGSDSHDKWFKNPWDGNGPHVNKLFNQELDSDSQSFSEVATNKEVAIAFYGGARQVDHNSAFKFAAINTQASYGTVYSKSRLFAKSGQFIVDSIEGESDNSIGRIDIITHASSSACYMVRNIDTEATGEFEDIPEDKREANYLFASRTSHVIEGGWDVPEGDDTATIYSINCAKFADNAVIEFHGCNIATAAGLGLYDNIAENLSEELYSNEKKEAVVIGHGTKANPNINGDNTKIKDQDYRHGKRLVYHNGTVLFTTNKSKHIGRDVIKKFIDKKAKDPQYDGTKETY